MPWRNVIYGDSSHSVEQADAIEFIRELPDDSIDLLITSPPYLDCRTYGIAAGRDLEEWVAWMMDFVRAASSKVLGPIIINCEGKQEDFRYFPGPSCLEADLHRAGFNLRKAGCYHRYGIPGSGGDEYLRNDWEPVLVITRPGRLPYSNPKACGKPPKYKPGGGTSHRAKNGKRKVAKSGDEGGYKSPEISNPGNVIQRTYTASEVAEIIRAMGGGDADIQRYVVGGGNMGHALAHENEAPFPLDLPKFYISTFCPPKGVVLDTFCGSGTTAHACRDLDRRFIGCDLRESQVALTSKRMQSVTMPIPGLLELF